MTILLYPAYLLAFWYVEAPTKIIKFYKDINLYVLQMLSVPLFLRTFFKPAKGEYRKGLVGVSITMGIIVKTIFLIADFFLLFFILCFEIILLLLFLAMPVLTILIFLI